MKEIELPYYFCINNSLNEQINEYFGKIESERLTIIIHTANNAMLNSDKYEVEIFQTDFDEEYYSLFICMENKSSQGEFEEILLKAAIPQFAY